MAPLLPATLARAQIAQRDERAIVATVTKFLETSPGATKIDVCGVNVFPLRKGPDGWQIFQKAATSRTDGCRAIAK